MMIECYDISFSYAENIFALKNIDLSIDKREFVGILGENGAGKTTLAKCINGLLKPQFGKILIDGEDTNNFSVAQLAKKIGFVFQNSDHQIFAQSVEDEIKFGLRNLNYAKEEIEERVEIVLKDLDLEQYRETTPFDLSGGERKRVALASILCLDPKILILDEPTIGQDSRQKKFLIKLIDELRDQDKTIIVITHDIEFASEYIPRIIIMSKGQILADGPNNVITKNEFILNSSNLILPQLSELSKILSSNEKFKDFKSEKGNAKEYYEELKKFLK
ncbi:MAG: ATP-binding cassette domain-containing protein [Candidatus Lokiarchaeota archaeon]|nr:ATP-binding cassette domain-containing protein [Candidatus Lokiarchaeota archaeon]